MTDQSSPITPPPELYAQWRKEAPLYNGGYVQREVWFMDRAAQWGWDQRGTINEAQLQERADQELDACCEVLRGEMKVLRSEFNYSFLVDPLRAARRSEPPTLKEQALAALDDAVMRGDCITISDALPTLRRALKALPND